MTTIDFLNLMDSLDEEQKENMEYYNPEIMILINGKEKKVKDVLLQDKKTVFVLED